MPQSKRKLEIICEMFRDLATRGTLWISIPELGTEADRRQLNLTHALIGDYVRRYAINDPSNRTASPKHYLDTPRFVTSDPRNKRGRKYRLLTENEREAFLRLPSEELHAQPYAEVEARYWPQTAKPMAAKPMAGKPMAAKPTAKPGHAARRPEARERKEERESQAARMHDARIKVHELARELRIAHEKVIEVAQRLGADASLPKSPLDEMVAAHIRLELAPKKEPAPAAVLLRATSHQTPPQVPRQAPKRTRAAAAAPAKVEEPAAVSKVSRTTPRRRTPSAALKAAKPEAASPAPAPASKDGARKSQPPVVIVDVSNVAREECDEKGRAKLETFLHLVAQLERSGVKIIAIADASLWGQIDREEEFKDYCRRGIIKQAPSRTEADAWILQKASESGGYIISRDNFRERIARYPGIRDRMVPFMVFDGEVMLDPEHPFTAMLNRPVRKKR